MPSSSLRDLLEGNDLPATVAALREAVEARDTAVLEDLERRLARPAPAELQAALLLALGQLGGVSSELAVRGFTRHADPGVRQAAETALLRLTAPGSTLTRLGGHRPTPAVPEPAPRPALASAPATPTTGSPIRWEKFLAPPPPPAVSAPPAAPARKAARRAPLPPPGPAAPATEPARPKLPPMRRCPVCGESSPRKLSACPSCHEKFV